MDRIGVFPTVEPPHGDRSAGVGECLASHDERMGEVIEEVGLGSRIELFLIFRRHLTGVEHIEHLLPSLGRLNGIDRGGQRVDPKATVGIVGPVACSAVGCEEGEGGGLHRSRRTGRRVGETCVVHKDAEHRSKRTSHATPAARHGRRPETR